MQDDLIERLGQAKNNHVLCAQAIARINAGTRRIAALEAEVERLMGLVKEAGEGFSGPTAWLERWATHVGNCHGGALCECGLTLASLESATTLAKIKEATDA